jgi:hypothetical protein
MKLAGKSTNIRELIEIDGYYPLPGSLESNDSPNPSNIGCEMFFEDGSWVYFHFQSEVPNNKKQANMSRYLLYWNESSDWGVYKIEYDTIILYRYLQGGFLIEWGLDEVKYKIIDRNTIQKIDTRGLLKADHGYYKMIEEGPMHFTPADSLPSSDCWLKEKKWIWQNESDWKSYMQHVEQVKKQYKKK